MMHSVILVMIGGLALGVAILVVIFGIPGLASAKDLVSDYGIGCGNRLWGIKDDLNNREANQSFFGRDNGCAEVAPFNGRSNVAKLHVAMNTAGQSDKTAWEAMTQGKGAWGETGNPKPVESNQNFPASSTNNYNLRSQWVWDDSQHPISPDIHAHFLTDLWFCASGSQTDSGCPYTSNYVVVDFMWMDLNNTGGHWIQNASVADTAPLAPGIQYRDPFCAREEAPDHSHSTNVFHYNVVLDNTPHQSGIWAEKTANINQYLSDAFNYQYPASACTTNSPGQRSSYSIVSVESGIELYGAAGDQGKIDGGYSYAQLSY